MVQYGPVDRRGKNAGFPEKPGGNTENAKKADGEKPSVQQRVTPLQVALGPIGRQQQVETQRQGHDAGRLLEQEGDRHQGARQNKLRPDSRAAPVQRDGHRRGGRQVHEQLTIERQAPVVGPGSEKSVEHRGPVSCRPVEQPAGDEVQHYHGRQGPQDHDQMQTEPVPGAGDPEDLFVEEEQERRLPFHRVEVGPASVQHLGRDHRVNLLVVQRLGGKQRRRAGDRDEQKQSKDHADTGARCSGNPGPNGPARNSGFPFEGHCCLSRGNFLVT